MQKYYLYVVLTSPHTAISKLIKLFKNDNYTHASISLDKDLTNMYSFSRKKAYNPFIGVFKHEKFDKGIYKFHKELPGRVMEIEVTKEQYEDAIKLLHKFTYNSEVYKYNYKGLLYMLLNKEILSDDRFLCSEFVYYILNESYIVDLNISRNLVRPENLLEIESEIVYEGNLKEMYPSRSIKSMTFNYIKNKIGMKVS
ncbi:hypothetical protein [Senegalia massiliensis]|uniref:Uncharacterized protein n=1 Tax=Senegalia massiliensis TaxID=1720316 RepID=A0A845QY60_9CLOT|nr:hypothetical protein [Senegalia massiliensis]NBI06082.1 hypothetical protein [Senegalia massiliensis]